MNSKKKRPRSLQKKEKIDEKPELFRAVDPEKAEGRTLEPLYVKGLSAKEKKEEFHSRIQATSGASELRVGLSLLASSFEALRKPASSPEESVMQLNLIGDMMRSFEPQDEVEGQLVAQLTVLHEHSLIWLGKAMRTERVDFANTYLNGASKLLARHHETLASLLKYRRGGEQRVHVEHVHVHNGGNAIVGNVKGGRG